jgi:hypothetical protein
MRILSISINTSGPSPKKHFITELGAVFFDKNKFNEKSPETSIIAQFKCFLPQPANLSWCGEKLNNFWKKNPEIYINTMKQIASATLTDPNVAESFINWVRRNQDSRPEYNLLICNNAAVDFVFLSRLLEDTIPNLEYIFGKETHQNPQDVSSFYLGKNRSVTYVGDNPDESAYKDAPNFQEIMKLQEHNALDAACLLGLKYLYVNNEKDD